ncbi:histidine phosphotransferase family protein [Lutimaribacter marinistellae]|uniref:Histidine phosphotransferase family protein n=1 Tax=Lutimaribacter marinistellae TaxID=1820329 RepID=A0ABV7TNI2_9RHOB
MGEHDVNLAALIGSRICHDLISPVGAITNGLELLEMAGAVQGAEMELISDSVGNAGARLRFFRIAYGLAGAEQVGPAEIAALFADLNRGSRVQTRWDIDGAQPRCDVKLAFLALQCCETAMPFGGTASVRVEDGRLTVNGTAQKLKIDPDLWQGLSAPGGAARITPALVQFALLPREAAAADRRVRVETGDGTLTIRL